MLYLQNALDSMDKLLGCILVHLLWFLWIYPVFSSLVFHLVSLRPRFMHGQQQIIQQYPRTLLYSSYWIFPTKVAFFQEVTYPTDLPFRRLLPSYSFLFHGSPKYLLFLTFVSFIFKILCYICVCVCACHIHVLFANVFRWDVKTFE